MRRHYGSVLLTSLLSMLHENSVSVFETVDPCLTAETCRTVVARRDKDGGV